MILASPEGFQSAEFLLEKIKVTETNEEFLESMNG